MSKKLYQHTNGFMSLMLNVFVVKVYFIVITQCT